MLGYALYLRPGSVDDRSVRRVPGSPPTSASPKLGSGHAPETRPPKTVRVGSLRRRDGSPDAIGSHVPERGT